MSRSRSFELGDQAERSTDHWTMPHSGPAITTLCDNSQGNPKRDEPCERRPNLLKTQFMKAESGFAAFGLSGRSRAGPRQSFGGFEGSGRKNSSASHRRLYQQP